MLKSSRLGFGADRRQERPADEDPRRLRQHGCVQGERPPGADQEVPGLRLPGQVPAAVRQASTTCCRRPTRPPRRCAPTRSSAPFMKALPNSIQYPSATCVGSGEDRRSRTRSAPPSPADPASVLGQLQQAASAAELIDPSAAGRGVREDAAPEPSRAHTTRLGPLTQDTQHRPSRRDAHQATAPIRCRHGR